MARCEKGHVVGVYYNSCRNRCCPSCGWGLGRKWLTRQSRTLLGCGHHHVIFTIPHEFNALWPRNQRVLGSALFKAASAAISKLAGDRRYLGAQPGIIIGLHTWGQQLGLHLHLHCLVSGGGLDAQGKWVMSRRKWFLPEEPLLRLFRGKLIYAVRGLVRDGSLRLPDGWTAKDVERLCDRVKGRHWNIDVRERYEQPTHVLKYLGRYLNGGPINESRLVSVSEEAVQFTYKDYRDTNPFGVPAKKLREMSREQFVQRLMQHVPPKGFHMVRGYGAYRAGGMTDEQREALRLALPLSFELQAELSPRSESDAAKARPQICPRCNSAVHLIYYGRGSPELVA